MRRVLTILLTLAILVPAASAQEGRITVVSSAPFARVAEALEQAIAQEQLALVCHANAQRGAAARGVSIRGNQVLMVFRNDFAVRLLEADPAAGFEAPLRIYVYENPDGTATISYRSPAAVFAPYRHRAVQAVAAELEPIFRRIVEKAASVH
ncbi:MAG: DUF302 domain-containing protein [Armatimonadota bacterium]|nr:DUF302 domain-containing protein [Armatimonadota bacterium]